MAGQPRRAGRPPRPHQRAARAANRKAQLARNWATAQTPMDRLRAAFASLTSAANGHQPRPEWTAQQVEEAARTLHAIATRLLDDHERAGATQRRFVAP